MGKVVLGFLAFAFTLTCILGCGEDSRKVYNVRQRRDRLSENVVIGMDYVGKPKIVCHCDAEGVQRLTSRSILASKREDVVKVKPEALRKDRKRREAPAQGNSSSTEDDKLQEDFIYSPTCCKIDLTNPKKLYSYPFTLRLPDQTYSKELEDPSSQSYQQLKNKLISGLTTLLANEGCVVSIDISKFRNGSVLADVALAVQGLISQSIIDTLKSAIESGSIGGLKVEIVPELPPNEMPKTTPIPTTPPPGELSKYPFTLKLTDQVYVDALADPTSTEYKALKDHLVAGLTTEFAKETNVASIDVTFRQGSVLADVEVSVRGNVSESLKDTVKTATESGVIGNMKVESAAGPNSTNATTAPTAGPTPAPTEAPPPPPEKSKSLADGGDTGTTGGDTGTTGGDTGTTGGDTGTTGGETGTAGAETPPTQSTFQIATIPPPAPIIPPKPATTTPAPPTTPAPVMTPENPVDSRPTIPYATETPGKEFKAAIILPEKSFDANLNIPSSVQYLDLKKMMEQSLTEIFKGNPEFESVTVLSFRPAVYKPSSKTTGPVVAASRRASVPLMGVEATLDFKFREARPGLMSPLETQLKVGTIASHAVSPNMAIVIIKDEASGLPGAPSTSCASTCRQPTVCYPACSARCCSPTQLSSCPNPCPSMCAPSCSSSCCALTKRNYTARRKQ